VSNKVIRDLDWDSILVKYMLNRSSQAYWALRDRGNIRFFYYFLNKFYKARSIYCLVINFLSLLMNSNLPISRNNIVN